MLDSTISKRLFITDNDSMTLAMMPGWSNLYKGEDLRIFQSDDNPKVTAIFPVSYTMEIDKEKAKESDYDGSHEDLTLAPVCLDEDGIMTYILRLYVTKKLYLPDTEKYDLSVLIGKKSYPLDVASDANRMSKKEDNTSMIQLFTISEEGFMAILRSGKAVLKVCSKEKRSEYACHFVEENGRWVSSDELGSLELSSIYEPNQLPFTVDGKVYRARYCPILGQDDWGYKFGETYYWVENRTGKMKDNYFSLYSTREEFKDEDGRRIWFPHRYVSVTHKYPMCFSKPSAELVNKFKTSDAKVKEVLEAKRIADDKFAEKYPWLAKLGISRKAAMWILVIVVLLLLNYIHSLFAD